MKPAVAVSPAPRLPWAVARLRLGQANVGLWVLTALAVVAFLPVGEPAGLAEDAVSWAGLIGTYVAVQALFDVVGGYTLPVVHSRRPRGVTRWMSTWVPAVVLHATFLFILGLLAMTTSRVLGDVAALVLCGLVGLGITVAQGKVATRLSQGTAAPEPPLLQALTEAGLDPSRARVVDTDDSGFVGGWVGLPGQEILLVPARWASLPAQELRATLVRRRLGLTTGSRVVGAMGALAYNAFGAGLILGLLPHAGLHSPHSLLVTSAGFTLWAFVGLLTLPTLSRAAVTNLDQATVATLGDSRALAAAITSLDQLQEDERQRAPWTETIFHPVPARSARVDALKVSSPTRPVPWRITRLALFNGSAYFSWLSRSVRCNIGRPEVWAVYPGD